MTGPAPERPPGAPARVIVCGGRHFTGQAAWSLTIAVLAAIPADTVLVHGACRTGLDEAAQAYWAGQLGRATEPHPADWPGPCHADCPPGHRRVGRAGVGYCPMAGFRRNQAMADAGAAMCVAFPGGRGTADMARRAKAAAIPVISAEDPTVRESLRDLLGLIDEPGFSCPRCAATSLHPEDLREGYCGRCHDFTGRARRG